MWRQKQLKTKHFLYFFHTRSPESETFTESKIQSSLQCVSQIKKNYHNVIMKTLKNANRRWKMANRTNKGLLLCIRIIKEREGQTNFIFHSHIFNYVFLSSSSASYCSGYTHGMATVRIPLRK